MSTSGGVGLTPGQGTKIPHALWQSQKQQNIVEKTDQLNRIENAHKQTHRKIVNQSLQRTKGNTVDQKYFQQMGLK